MRRMGIGLGVGINRSNYAQGIFGAYATRVVADGGVVEAGSCVDAVSGLLLSASLLLIPSGYKGGKLYSEIPTNGNGDLTWTRGSDAFRTNASGLIQRVPWNLLEYSEQFENAYWTKEGATITSNTTTAPNGTITAEKIDETATTGIHRVGRATFPSGTQRTLSVFAKKSERNFVCLFENNSVGNTVKGVIFNLNTGAISTNNDSSFYFNSTIQNMGDGWYRCLTSWTPLSLSVPSVGISSDGSNNSYVGTAGNGIFIWGAQLVEGTTAQTYLPTTDRLNFPRLDYTYGSCPAVLLEPQRTNLALQSETFDNASWSKTNASVTANSTTAPDGNTTADTLLANGASGIHRTYQLATFVSGTSYTISVYAKKNTNDFFQVVLGDSVFNSAAGWANFDLNNGTIGTKGAQTNANITDVDNGWYRCSITATAVTSLAETFVFVLISSSTSVRQESNSLSTSVFIWGAQLEAGAYPTTYIPTTSATATRVADSFSRSNIYTNGLITASGGTWFVELRGNLAYTRDAGGFFGLLTSSTLSTNGFVIKTASGTSQRLFIGKRVADVESLLYTTITDTIKVAIKWNGTSADVFVNGTKQVSATSFTATVMEFLTGNAVDVPKFIQQMALYPSPLSDTDCTTLTTL